MVFGIKSSCFPRPRFLFEIFMGHRVRGIGFVFLKVFYRCFVKRVVGEVGFQWRYI